MGMSIELCVFQEGQVIGLCIGLFCLLHCVA